MSIPVFDAFDQIAARTIGGPPDYFDLPTQPDLDRLSEMTERSLGLRWVGEAGGASLAIDGNDNIRMILERNRVYVPVPCDGNAIAGGVVACIRRVHDRCGPGAFWTTAGRPHVVTDDGRPRVWVLQHEGGATANLIVRLYYFHDGGRSIMTKPDPLLAIDQVDNDHLQWLYEQAERELEIAAKRAATLRDAVRSRGPR